MRVMRVMRLFFFGLFLICSSAICFVETIFGEDSPLLDSEIPIFELVQIRKLHLSIYLAIYLSTYLSIYLSIYLSDLSFLVNNWTSHRLIYCYSYKMVTTFLERFPGTTVQSGGAIINATLNGWKVSSFPDGAFSLGKSSTDFGGFRWPCLINGKYRAIQWIWACWNMMEYDGILMEYSWMISWYFQSWIDKFPFDVQRVSPF